jgi:septal ring factor EnvC (AmiA/AmiB activator)
MLREDEASWHNPKVLLILALIFMCGLGAGSAVTQYVVHSKIARSKSMASRLKDLKTSLILTPDQEQIVNKELDDYAKYYQNIEEERISVAEHGKQKILQVLNPEQKKRFNEMFDQLPH